MKHILQWALVLAGLVPLGVRGQSANCTGGRYTGPGTTFTTGGSQSGLFGQYYAGVFYTQPGFTEATPLTFFSGQNSGVSRNDQTVNFTNAGFGNVNGNGTGTPTSFSARYRGGVYLKSGGAYRFYLTADDAAYLFLGKEAALASPTPANAFIRNAVRTGAPEEVSAYVSVAASNTYDLQLLFAQASDSTTLRLEYSGGPDNLSRRVVPATALCAGPSGRTYTTNVAPVANTITNEPLLSDGSTEALVPSLSAFDLDGTVVSYQITTLPTAGTVFDNGSPIGAGSLPYTVLAANVGNLSYRAATNSSGTYTIQYRATDNSGAQSTAVGNYRLPVSNLADLGTTLAASTQLGSPAITAAPQGSLVFYTATTTNSGPAPASTVRTTINLPAGLTGVSLSNSGTYDAATGIATFPTYTLAVGGSISRNIAFTMPANTVNATATAASATVVDPNSNNNTGATFTTPTQVADVSVALNGPTRVLTNQAVVYSVVPTNIGPSTATGIALRAQLATGLAGVVASGPGAPGSGSYNPISGVVTWPLINSLPNGGSLVYTVRFNSPSAVGGTITASGSATTTTANGDPVAVNNDGTAALSIISTQVVNTAATLLCVTPGQDGDVTLASNFNTYFPGQAMVSAGATSIALGAANLEGAAMPIVAGDLLLIMQMQGGDIDATNTDAYGDGVNGDNLAAGVKLDANFTAGVYEYAIAANSVGAGGGTLTLTQGLGFSYLSQAATNTTGQRRFQVIRVPRYRNVTLSGNVTAPAWNGLTGGVMALDVDGTLNLAGFKLDMVGRGFRGAAGQVFTGATGVAVNDYRNSNAKTTNANKGEGTAGTPRYLNSNGSLLDTQASGLLPLSLADGYPSGDRGRGAPGNAGGGGGDGQPGSNQQNTGGGGGSNAGRGGVGGNAWDSNSATGGYGGAGFTQATASRIIMGGGGGAGTTNNATGTPANGFASSGAAGGGIIIIRASLVNASGGTIDVSGASMPYIPANDGSGGGGAGGSVIVLCNVSNGNANSTVLANVVVLANGGNGGSNTGGGSPHGPGGGGAGGVSFTSSPTNTATSLIPGKNGSTFGFATYGSGVGSASLGQGLSNITRANLPNVVVGCPADVVTTLAASTASTAPGSVVSFTATTVNNGEGLATAVYETIRIEPNLATVSPNGQTAFSIGASGLPTFADGSTYDPATGIVTFSAVPTLAVGATLVNATSGVKNYVSFAMPSQNVVGTATGTSANDLDPRLANNDGTLPAANVKVTAVNDISGIVYDDVNYGGGRGRDYATANASAIASGFTSGAIGSAGTTVELFDNTGAIVQTTVTGSDGGYGFSGIPTGNYVVRVVSSTVRSVRRPTNTEVVGVQTFRTDNGVADLNRVGGEDPTRADGPANFSTSTLSFMGQNVGGTKTVFIDRVEILNASGVVVATGLVNNSFENPSIGGGFTYNPTNAGWTFNGNAGIAANGSGFSPPPTMAGTQVGFVENQGSIVQVLPSSLPVGNYQIRFQASQRGRDCAPCNQTVSVQVNGAEIARVTPPNNDTNTTYTSSFFTVSPVNNSVTTQSIAPVTLGASGAANVNFGFNFDVVTNTNPNGQGSLRQFILNANALPNGNLAQAASSNGGATPTPGIETSIFMMPSGAGGGAARHGLRAGLTTQFTGGVGIIAASTATFGALPAFTDANTTLDATTQTQNGGNSNTGNLGTTTAVGTAGTARATLPQPEVQLVGTPGEANSDYGLQVAAGNITVRGMSVYGFGNTAGNLNGANIYVTGNATTGTLITGNTIGTTASSATNPAAGTRSTGHGVLLANFTAGVPVSATISNNMLAFNGASGVENLASSATAGVLITGNEIKNNGQQNAASDGVRMGLAGGTVQNNLITANRNSGVDFTGSAGGILLTGNTITGNGTAGGAELSGVRAFGQGNMVTGNVITGNAGHGVVVLPGTNAPNVPGSTSISQNSIETNTLLGISLVNTSGAETSGAPTLNDMDDVDGNTSNGTSVGGNGLLNFPVIVEANISGTNLLVRGYARPGATVEFFYVGPGSTSADPSGFGEGITYLASGIENNSQAVNGPIDLNPQTRAYSGPINGRDQGSDYTSLFQFTIPLSSLPLSPAMGSYLSATATLPGVGTSEFSGITMVGSGPLPVELTAFTAVAVKNVDAVLNWRTASEKNNDRFEVERSFTGMDFAKIGEVQGQGTSSTPSTYTLTDAGVGPKSNGLVYYRLRQVDRDGTASYSPVRTVSFAKGMQPIISMYPNPASGTTALDLTGLPTGSYQVYLIDATGRRVLDTVLTSGLTHSVDLSPLASGSYQVLVRGTSGGPALNLSQRLIKE